MISVFLAQQGKPQQGWLGDVESSTTVIAKPFREPLLAGIMRNVAPIEQCPGQRNLPMDDLKRLVIAEPERGPEGRVARNHDPETTLKRSHVEIVAELQPHLLDINSEL